MKLLRPEPHQLPGRPEEHRQEHPVQPARTSIVFEHEDEDRKDTPAPPARFRSCIGSLQIMHPFQLIVNSRRRLQNILQGSLGINQETAVGAAWLNSAAGVDVRTATDW